MARPQKMCWLARLTLTCKAFFHQSFATRGEFRNSALTFVFFSPCWEESQALLAHRRESRVRRKRDVGGILFEFLREPGYACSRRKKINRITLVPLQSSSTGCFGVELSKSTILAERSLKASCFDTAWFR